jgi:hypothetical protein
MGLDISYKPENTHLELFEPNMTSYIQLLDAGIIQCFKTHYQKAFCMHTIKLDEVGATDIYKINLLEVMLMTKAAWDAVLAETI